LVQVAQGQPRTAWLAHLVAIPYSAPLRPTAAVAAVQTQIRQPVRQVVLVVAQDALACQIPAALVILRPLVLRKVQTAATTRALQILAQAVAAVQAQLVQTAPQP
jgi:hypothetical protein